jgi:hypothetical protein
MKVNGAGGRQNARAREFAGRSRCLAIVLGTRVRNWRVKVTAGLGKVKYGLDMSACNGGLVADAPNDMPCISV